MRTDLRTELEAAAEAVRRSTALLVTAGAGMGVDSGLPDFRGNEGFWKAYPPFAKLGLSFVDLANPRWFERDPHLAWGFYGHRLALYRRTVPHAGFAILKRWGSTRPHGSFVFTSNVDGQFQRAGFDPERVLECHGAIDYVQCTGDCGVGIVRADDWIPDVDETSMRLRGELPRCPRCGALQRPNILMFDDFGWDAAREIEQSTRFDAWMADVMRAEVMADVARDREHLVVVECGAGRAVPTVRNLGDRLASRLGAKLVRINVREPEVPNGQVGLPCGALEALSAIDSILAERT